MDLTTTELVKRGFALFPWGWVRNNPEAPLIRYSPIPQEKYWVEMGNGFRIRLKTIENLETLLSLCAEEEKI
jgi:hypothetical protein